MRIDDFLHIRHPIWEDIINNRFGRRFGYFDTMAIVGFYKVLKIIFYV